jgi:hypothetical protein
VGVDAELVRAVTEALDKWIGHFGVPGTVAIVASCYLVPKCWSEFQKYQERKTAKADREVMEQAVQRAASEARDYRLAFFKDKFGWSEEELERLHIGAQFLDGPTARKALENPGSRSAVSTQEEVASTSKKTPLKASREGGAT